ncbi:hypothetical protein AMST5_01885 [freshwater sediment metagenome]|jgi:hypothetical protein|uniref:Uncharacterized protein n=1 Tax=freshwater sediment metagenome TaxID=556182 RepID=A0AA48RAN8_9ZZZZ
MARLVFLLALLSGLGGFILGSASRTSLRHERLPPSLGYADVISEGVGSN